MLQVHNMPIGGLSASKALAFLPIISYPIIWSGQVCVKPDNEISNFSHIRIESFQDHIKPEIENSG